jgi:hypothetical protein
MDINWDEDLSALRVEDGKVMGVKCGLLKAEDAYDLQPGDTYFRLISATFIDEVDAKGQHNLFVDVVDENNSRLNGATVVHGWPWNKWPGEDEHVTDKVYGGHLANWGIYADYDANAQEYGPYWVRVDGKSDVFYGMGLPWKRHVSWSAVFQRATFGDEGNGGNGGGGSGDLAAVLARLDSIDARLRNLEDEVRALHDALRRAGEALGT